jgi:hypothetical protein
MRRHTQAENNRGNSPGRAEDIRELDDISTLGLRKASNPESCAKSDYADTDIPQRRHLVGQVA